MHISSTEPTFKKRKRTPCYTAFVIYANFFFFFFEMYILWLLVHIRILDFYAEDLENKISF